MAMKEYMNPAVHTLRRSAIREFTKLAAETPGCVRLTLGEPDFPTPAIISEAAAASLKGGDTHYITNSGSAALRSAVSEYEESHNGLSYNADEVIITAGATEALFISLLGIIKQGDEVIIPYPAFVLYEEIVCLCGGTAVPMDTSGHGFQITPELLGQHVTGRTKAIILNSPNNPTGCIYNKQSLETVRDVVSGKPIFVLCDDVYRQLCYADDYHSFAEFTEMKEQIIVIQSFSKPYAMTGWRMGYLMADRSITERLELIHQYDIVSTPAPFQKACIAALSHDPGYMIGIYRDRRDFVCKYLERMGLEQTAPEGAFYVFPSIRRFGMSSAEFCRRLIKEAGVAVTPGGAFGSDDHIRISYCCSMEDIKEGIGRLGEFVRKIEAEGYAERCRSI